MVADCTCLPGLGTYRVPSRSCLAVPAIGFVHDASGRSSLIDAAASGIEGRPVRGEPRRANDYRDRLPKVIDYGAAAFIVMAVAFRPMAWLIAG